MLAVSFLECVSVSYNQDIITQYLDSTELTKSLMHRQGYFPNGMRSKGGELATFFFEPYLIKSVLGIQFWEDLCITEVQQYFFNCWHLIFQSLIALKRRSFGSRQSLIFPNFATITKLLIQSVRSVFFFYFDKNRLLLHFTEFLLNFHVYKATAMHCGVCCTSLMSSGQPSVLLV